MSYEDLLDTAYENATKAMLPRCFGVSVFRCFGIACATRDRGMLR